ncbi:hypothetical protein WOLCODRAFT_129982 [Wolfiporia cocos MD-104 SS10]|uniref:Mediator of RNA polymerase II transcription subunit 5 n=1 Tax=Wolfiporia cocos (strain MD-104) TaxID=742152 RepID=A0A2H3IVN7_WOLCO|nr:hypothetical protein WOLCODRAFT_129982 [Wolfiporia cocos MD-104 SS10]
MSLSELTRNSFQSGITAKKWANLCKLFLAKNGVHDATDEVQTDISNSVLVLFRNYPGDPALQGYLKRAIQDGLLSLPRFIATFLSAARSPDLHTPATLDMLCRVALDAHYATGLSNPIGSIVAYTVSTTELLATVQDSMALLRVAYSLPMSHFHQLTTSTSELLALLLSCITDVTQIPTNEAVVFLAEANDLMHVLHLPPFVKQELETFVLSLGLLLGDDGKAAQAQMMRSLQVANDLLGPGSDTDIISCSLLLQSLVLGRAHEFGAGEGNRATAVLLAMLRWSSWTPVVHHTQLIQSALTCLFQNVSMNAQTKPGIIWRAFVIGRLPTLLNALHKAADQEGGVESDWHSVVQAAVSNVMHRSDILDRCEIVLQSGGTEINADRLTHSRVLQSEFLYQLMKAGLLDQAFAATLQPSLVNDFHPRLPTEAQELGLDLAAYIESKLATEVSVEDAIAFVDKVCRDACSHAAFADAVYKKFVSLHHPDLDSLSHICKILSRHELAVDIVSLHHPLTDMVTHALKLVEDYDCETVGDPQTAVSHLGDVVLFLQETVVRYNFNHSTLNLGDQRLNLSLICSVSTVHTTRELSSEDTSAVQAWAKALFDKHSEGIEDTILRNTRPRTLLHIAATLFSHAIMMCDEGKMEKDVLSDGISYFMGPLLNWTLVGVVKSLLSEIQRRGLNAPLHLEVLQTLLLSQSCPQTVIRLSAASVLRLSTSKLQQHVVRFDWTALQSVAAKAIGLPEKNLQGTSSHAINGALAAARAGRAPALDVDRCLLFTPPAKFLHALWKELMGVATLGEIEAPRRLTTFVLSMPRRFHSPPLLPIFLHVVVPGLVAAADHLPPTDQAIAVELLVSVISSALTMALHLERALLNTCGEQRPALGQSAAAMARRMGSDLRRKGHGQTSGVIAQRLAALPPFVANFPTFIADM